MTTTAQYGVALYGDSYYDLLALNCASGSYSITGGEASFEYDQVLQGNAGNYTLAGQDVGLLYNQRIECEAGSYSLTGNTNTFLYNQTIYAGAFSFILSGQEAGIVKDYLMTAEAGSFALTGQTASFLHNRSLKANKGSYALSGKPAELVAPAPFVVVESKGGTDKKEKKKRQAEKQSREELEAIIKREFDILDGTYEPEVVIEARKAISAPLQQIDFTSYDLAIAQVNALLLQAKIQAAEYQAELDDEEALLMLL